MREKTGFGYMPKNSVIHSLTGATKFIMVLLASISIMITFDTRFLIGMIVVSLVLMKLSKIKFREIKFAIYFIAIFLILNNIFIYLFSPEQGVEIYKTRHELVHLIGNYSITKEQLFYHLNVTLKYFSIVPIALLFFITTEPSEFAASLNKLGVSYKVSYAVTLALRYIPDIKRDYHEISQAQQARGIDMSKNVKLTKRAKSASAIMFPLVFLSLNRIETISNAMELRRFGKKKKRTWYRARQFAKADFVVIAGCVLSVAIAVVLNILNKSRFYNPFV